MLFFLLPSDKTLSFNSTYFGHHSCSCTAFLSSNSFQTSRRPFLSLFIFGITQLIFFVTVVSNAETVSLGTFWIKFWGYNKIGSFSFVCHKFLVASRVARGIGSVPSPIAIIVNRIGLELERNLYKFWIKRRDELQLELFKLLLCLLVIAVQTGAPETSSKNWCCWRMYER